MAEWSSLIPAGGDAPPGVEAARREVEVLRARLPVQRQAEADAQAAVIEAETADRSRMAEELRAGRSAKADARTVERAEQRVAAVRREGEALLLAIQASEGQLGEAVRQSRDDWLRSAQRNEQGARARGRQALDELTQALQSLASARVTTYWLTELVDREQRAPAAVLGHLTGSERASANGDPLLVQQALGWIAERVAEPEPPPTPSESRPLAPIPTSGLGALIS